MMKKSLIIILNVGMMFILFLFVLTVDWRYIIKSPPAMEPQIGSRSFVTEKLQGDLDFEILIEEEGRTQEKKLTYELMRKLIEDERTHRENIATNDQETQNYKSKTIVNEGHKFSVKIPSYSGSQELILLVSSLGRGGSSWVGELLSNISGELIYIFEPLKIITDVYESRMTPSMVTEILSMVFSCQFTNAFSEYRKVWPQNFRKFPDECKGTHCFDPNILSERCRKAKTIVAKTIRLTLAHVELLMVMPNFQHLKVIYLSRDPRAQVLSRDEVFHIHKSEFTEECVKVEADVYAFRRLSQLFPGQFYFMRYEDFCQQPLVEALQLWKFIRTDHNATMPEEWQDFLTSHDQTKTAVEGQIKRFQYSTYRNSSTQWYKWREEKNITLESLLNVEEVCSTAMDRLGYIPLMNVENVKNLSLPFIRNYSCDFWNCWTHRF